jgi:DNA-binding MarR family transcriptional regulator
VGELGKAGYVELSGDESDRRAKRVRYSARGHRLIRDADAIDDELWQELTDRFGSRTIEDLGAAIRELHGALVGRDRPLLLEPAAARARSRKRLRPRRA